MTIPFCREGGVTAQDTYNLYLYERNVQVVGLRSIDAPILIDTIRTGKDTSYIIFFLYTRIVAALPEGVTLSVHEHTRDMEEERSGHSLPIRIQSMYNYFKLGGSMTPSLTT